MAQLTKKREKNGSWQLVKKKQHHCKRHCSQQGATQTTEARARPTASLVTNNEPKVRLKWLSMGILKACAGYSENCLLGSAPIPLLK